MKRRDDEPSRIKQEAGRLIERIEGEEHSRLPRFDAVHRLAASIRRGVDQERQNRHKPGSKA